MKTYGAAPKGYLEGTFAELFAAGCIQTGADRDLTLQQAEMDHGLMFAMLRTHSSGNVCDGCPAYRGGNCQAFQKFHTEGRRAYGSRDPKALPKPVGTDKFPGKSVKQIAKELNISISEVRRRKQAGTL